VERGNLLFDVKRKLQAVDPQGKSIDAMSRGGTIRSSDEVPVMGMEWRDCIIPFWTAVNLVIKGGANGQNKALWLDNGSRMNREIQVRFWEGLGVKFPRATYQYPVLYRLSDNYR